MKEVNVPPEITVARSDAKYTLKVYEEAPATAEIVTVSEVEEPATAYPMGAVGGLSVARLIDTVAVSDAAR